MNNTVQRLEFLRLKIAEQQEIVDRLEAELNQIGLDLQAAAKKEENEELELKAGRRKRGFFGGFLHDLQGALDWRGDGSGEKTIIGLLLMDEFKKAKDQLDQMKAEYAGLQPDAVSTKTSERDQWQKDVEIAELKKKIRDLEAPPIQPAPAPSPDKQRRQNRNRCQAEVDRLLRDKADKLKNCQTEADRRRWENYYSDAITEVEKDLKKWL